MSIWTTWKPHTYLHDAKFVVVFYGWMYITYVYMWTINNDVMFSVHMDNMRTKYLEDTNVHCSFVHGDKIVIGFLVGGGECTLNMCTCGQQTTLTRKCVHGRNRCTHLVQLK